MAEQRWVTINGHHVLINDDEGFDTGKSNAKKGKVVSGKGAVKDVPKNKKVKQDKVASANDKTAKSTDEKIQELDAMIKKGRELGTDVTPLMNRKNY